MVNSLKSSGERSESFLYDWTSKELGTVKDSTVELTSSLWTYSAGSKVSTDNQGDAKLIVKLAGLLTTAAQSAILTDE